jgi:hypothetical protein
LMDYTVAGLPTHIPDHLKLTLVVLFELHFSRFAVAQKSPIPLGHDQRQEG